MIHVATIVGARPQFVKAAAVSRAVATSDTVVETLIHTGQHFDPEMSTTFFRELEMPEPNYWLGVNGGTASEMTGRLLVELDHVLSEVDPHLVLTYGDTNSTLAGSLVAAQRRIPQAHVDGEFRTYAPVILHIKAVVETLQVEKFRHVEP